MNILITGGLGYIGSSLIKYLNFLRHNITVVDNLYTQRYCSLFEKGNVFEFIENDFINLSIDWLKRFDCIIHCAAIVDASNSEKQKDLVNKVNIYQTLEFLYRCNRAEIKIIFPSSTSVYGTSNKIVYEDDPFVLKPQSPYAEAKLFVEKAIAELDCVILRFGTVCGVSSGIRFQTCINKFCYQAVFNQPLSVWKQNLNLVRPYLSLSDIRNIIGNILKDWNKFSGQTFNVLTRNLSLIDIIEKIKNHQPKITVNYTDCPLLNQFSYEVNTKKIEKLDIDFIGSIDQDIQQTMELLKRK